MPYSFEWNIKKNIENQKKHSLSFEEAQFAFSDKQRLILADPKHSKHEKRYFCIAKIKKGVVTVRFTFRKKKIRIIGAAFWRAGKKRYLSEVKGKYVK